MLNINSLKIIEQFSEPYPLIVYSDFLDVSQLDSLKDSLSSNETTFDGVVMGNRKKIMKGSTNFEKLLKKNTSANDINSFFEIKSNFEYFYNNLEKLNLKKKNFNFLNKRFKLLDNFIIDNNNSSTSISLSSKLKNSLAKIFYKLNNDCNIYWDMDFSVASTGYWREPHHDREERIINFLFYINDFPSNEGGSLQIFDYKESPKKYLKQPNYKDLKMIKNIEPQKGYLVTFLSSPNSLHGVELIKKTNEKRYFFYGSYTSLNKIKWKKNI
jgi:Rps23 Pro-64 3,4-dihydroxylase Tpa1-like proline 4-hydroxylase